LVEGDDFARKEAAMTWTLLRPQQPLGTQFPPAEATKDRDAQEHDLPGSTAPKGQYPASRLQDRTGDNTPTAGDPRVEWDDVIQPERQVGEASHEMSDEQPPEGK
jgi:hypothetical protein